jgi:hypothetical protein
MLTWGRIYWPIFLILSGLWILTAFLIPEVIALLSEVKNHLDNTLSEYARTELHVSSTIQDMHDIAWWISLTAWVVFAVWATGHIWFDLWG